MIDLAPDQQDALTALVNAGANGLVLGDGITTGKALLFGLYGFADITNAKTPPQRAIATDRAKAFAWRTAA